MKGKDLQALVQRVIQKHAGFPEYLIVRGQVKREWSIQFNNGRIESVVTSELQGVGVQAFTREGLAGFASTDALTEEAVSDVARRAAVLAKHNGRMWAVPNTEIFHVPPVQEDLSNGLPADFWEKPFPHLQEEVAQIHRRLREAFPRAAWQTSYRQVAELWAISRSDRTLVSFAIPRTVLMHQGTVKNDWRAQSFLVHRSGVHWEVLIRELEERTLEQKAVARAQFAERLLAAPQLPPGHYPLVIDYGLAKGLAHEAFGHAVESDHMRESVLGENGKLRKGLRVASPGVHIIDGPLPGDWAYQPYSANGVKRRTVEIVKDGVLVAGLGDVFTAREAGMEITGAGRAESYAHLPLPRMSNIRLLVDVVEPLETSPDPMVEAHNIRKALEARGELQKRHLVLVGYRGGQVNPKTGDFVFQCSGIIDVGDPALPLYQPSIFSGKILNALKAIRFGLGEPCFDAIGTCGKSGQAVPSSGGSHKYLAFAEDPHVRLGGEG